MSSVNQPLVSIIIPCYNAEQYVGEAIKSAMDQTYPNKEVIVIDDGSTDGSLEVIKSFGNQIRWESGPNQGACAARNRGLALASGEFVQFLDADNKLAKDKIDTQANILLETRADIITCNGAPEGEATQYINRVNWVGQDIFSILTDLRPPVQTAACLHKMAMLKKVAGFYRGLPCCQEFDLHLRQAAEGARFLHLNEILYWYRRIPGSVSSNYEKVLDQHAPILKRVRESLRLKGMLTEGRAKTFAELLARDARQYYRMGRKEKAAAYFRLAEDFHTSAGLMSFSRSFQVAARLLGYIRAERVAEILRPLNDITKSIVNRAFDSKCIKSH